MDDKTDDLTGAEEAQQGSAQAAEGESPAETTANAAEEEVVSDTESSPEQKIALLEVKLAESHDQFLRKAAEFENFRKRMNQEKQSAIEYANQTLLLDIIPIIDDFERAIIAGETSSNITSFLEGVKMIENRLTSTLETKWGLKRFNSAGQPFDPNFHEALYMEKSADVKEAVVQENLIKGYLLKDRVIRAAKVKVLMPASEE